MTSLARTERSALADLLDQIGPDQPTLCEGWTTRDLAAHLIARERRPDTLPGIAVKAFAGHTESVRRSYAERPYAELVGLVRSGPGRLSPFGLPGVDSLTNTTEYAVHLEDVRRAQSGWRPRELPAKVQDAFWTAVSSRAPLAFRRLSCGVELRRTDRPDAARATVSKGEPVATISGEPLELLLYAFGRQAHAMVEVAGDPRAVALLDGLALEV